MQNDAKKVHTVLKYGYIRRSGNFFPNDTSGKVHMRRMCSLHQSTVPPQKKTCVSIVGRDVKTTRGMKALPPGTFAGYCVNNTKRVRTKRRPTSTLRVFGGYVRNNFLFHESRSKREEGREGLGKRPLSLFPASHSLEYGDANVPVGRLLYFLLLPAPPFILRLSICLLAYSIGISTSTYSTYVFGKLLS